MRSLEKEMTHTTKGTRNHTPKGKGWYVVQFNIFHVGTQDYMDTYYVPIGFRFFKSLKKAKSYMDDIHFKTAWGDYDDFLCSKWEWSHGTDCEFGEESFYGRGGWFFRLCREIPDEVWEKNYDEEE